MGFLLFLHVFGAVLFLGNIIVTAFWKVFAASQDDVLSVYSASKKVLIADFIFTLPGILLLLASGIIIAIQQEYTMNEFNWVTVSLGLFALTGLLWIAILLPLQLKMVRYSKQSVSQGVISQPYRQVYRYWTIVGSVATLIPIFILYLMTVKPF